MDPDVWGPEMWNLLFSIAFECKDKKRKEKLFGDVIQKFLPCEKCRINYQRYKKQISVKSMSEMQDGLWLWFIKDVGRRANGKSKIDFEQLQHRRKCFPTPITSRTILTLLMMTLVHTEENASSVHEFVELIAQLVQQFEQPLQPPILKSVPSLESVTKDTDYVRAVKEYLRKQLFSMNATTAVSVEDYEAELLACFPVKQTSVIRQNTVFLAKRHLTQSAMGFCYQSQRKK